MNTQFFKTRSDEIIESPHIKREKNLAVGADNHLILEINPEEHLDEIIERVKESYIRHHLKDKSIKQRLYHLRR